MEGDGTMKIVKCPKGGRVPEGYCKESCLNYPCKVEINRIFKLRNRKTRFSPIKILRPIEQSSISDAVGI